MLKATLRQIVLDLQKIDLQQVIVYLLEVT